MFRKTVVSSISIIIIIIITIIILILGACATPLPAATQNPEPGAEEIIFYDWPEDMPSSVLDAFTEEYGIKVTYVTYETQNEAIANMRQGEAYDVVVIDNDNIPRLVREDLLAEIKYNNVPNFKNISANFRDLAYDPGNKHSVPFNWGTTGLLFRSDLVQINSWADLWRMPAGSKIGFRDEPRDQLGAALKVLGYSINTEDAQELEIALEHLLKIRPHVFIVDSYADPVIPMLASGEIVALVGWAEDALEAREAHEAITYVLPEEGPMLWGDNFVIPANSPHKYSAEIFLNFLLRPEISAQIVNENYYANANEAALPFIDPEIRDDSVIYPPNEQLVKGEVYLPLSPDGAKVYREIWEHFKAAGQ